VASRCARSLISAGRCSAASSAPAGRRGADTRASASSGWSWWFLSFRFFIQQTALAAHAAGALRSLIRLAELNGWGEEALDDYRQSAEEPA
jgi:hypothetical protein